MKKVTKLELLLFQMTEPSSEPLLLLLSEQPSASPNSTLTTLLPPHEAATGAASSSTEADMAVLEEFIRTMIEGWRYQARVQSTWYSILVLLYASMILFGATGNLLVILVVVRNSAMRTARNVFIVNLAVSDLMLCLITMPLTLVEILYMTWQVGGKSRKQRKTKSKVI